MKIYKIGYIVKMNDTQDLYSLYVEAANAKEAKDKVKSNVFTKTGRNAFTPFVITDKDGERYANAINGYPPVK